MRSAGVDSVGLVTGEAARRLTGDGQAVQSALRDRGFTAEPVVWSDGSVDQSRYDALVVRSCWQYYTAPGRFREWLATAERAGTIVLNQPDVLRWNMHKFYLGDLESAGVPVLPTEYVEAEAQAATHRPDPGPDEPVGQSASDVTLESVLDRNDWTRAVVKPAIGTSSDGVWRVTAPVQSADEDRFRDQLADTDLLVQEFAPEIEDGERSFVFFGGEFSHAYRSLPGPDDFRTHPDFGGTVSPYDPSPTRVAQARDVLEAAGNRLSVELVYARVDGIERNGSFRLMELELIEPYLNLSMADGSVDRFVDAIEGAFSER